MKWSLNKGRVEVEWTSDELYSYSDNIGIRFYQGRLDDVPKHLKYNGEVRNLFKIKKLIESIGINKTPKECLTVFVQKFSKESVSKYMYNKARCKKKRWYFSMNITKDCFRDIMISNDVEVLNWDVDIIGSKYRYSIEYNEFVY